MTFPLLMFFVAALFLVHGFAKAQEAAANRKPLMVSHLSAENKALLRRPAAPKHSIFGKLICFKVPCRKYIGWRKRQRSMRFKGFKDGGQVPPPGKQPVIKSDTITLVRNTVAKAAPPAQPYDTLPIKERIFLLEEVLFQVNSAKFNDRFLFRLDTLVQLLTVHKSLRAAISGHTDNTGSLSRNLQLSNERAAAVANYLVSNNISRRRISYKGLGSTRPIADNTSKEGRQKNRRVEILLSE